MTEYGPHSMKAINQDCTKNGFFFLHFKIHKKSCRARALDSVDWKDLSCCSILTNDEGCLPHWIPIKEKNIISFHYFFSILVRNSDDFSEGF